MSKSTYPLKLPNSVKEAAAKLAKIDGVSSRSRGDELIQRTNGTVVRFQGLGAGRVPTATAVFADLLEHARVIESRGLNG